VEGRRARVQAPPPPFRRRRSRARRKLARALARRALPPDCEQVRVGRGGAGEPQKLCSLLLPPEERKTPHASVMGFRGWGKAGEQRLKRVTARRMGQGCLQAAGPLSPCYGGAVARRKAQAREGGSEAARWPPLPTLPLARFLPFTHLPTLPPRLRGREREDGGAAMSGANAGERERLRGTGWLAATCAAPRSMFSW
jgi:hypothetical protein